MWKKQRNSFPVTDNPFIITIADKLTSVIVKFTMLVDVTTAVIIAIALSGVMVVGSSAVSQHIQHLPKWTIHSNCPKNSYYRSMHRPAHTWCCAWHTVTISHRFCF